MTAPDPTAGEPHPTPTVLHDWTCSHDPCACATPYFESGQLEACT